MNRFIIILAALLIAVSAFNVSATEVSGDVWGEWDSSMNPIEVVGGLRVAVDEEIIIADREKRYELFDQIMFLEDNLFGRLGDVLKVNPISLDK